MKDIEISLVKDICIESHETDCNQNLKIYNFFQKVSQIAWEHVTQLGMGFENLKNIAPAEEVNVADLMG